MQRMAGETPINAHQQTSVPLLRRPRAPKPIKVASEKLKKISPHKNDELFDSEGTWNLADLSYLEFEEEPDDRSNFIIHSLYPRGPAFFPPGNVRHSHDAAVFEIAEPLPIIAEDPDIHNLHGWMPPRPVIRTSRSAAMISRQNYKKLTGWFATHVPTQENLNTIHFDLEAGTPPTRKPAQQAIIEFRALLDEVLCTGSAVSMETDGEELNRWPTPTSDDILFQSTTSRFFCGQGRCNSPFDASQQPLIDPSEVAVIESMVNGGRELSFKAHFISKLPDLYPLAHTLTHLNLSFNNFSVFPVEVLQLKELLCLRMRNNPLKEIPNGIHSLSKLKVLCMSFSLLSDLPPGLFELVALVDLDLSYNALHCLSRDIAKLVLLRKLNVEGNQLSGLPYPAAHSLSLSHLLTGDNLMHPLLWRENTRNQPQALLDLCCVAMATPKPHPQQLPDMVKECISRRKNGVCDQCGGMVYGVGLRVLRSINHTHFNVKNLPFIFIVCSPACWREVRYRENFDLSGSASDQQK